MVTNIFYKSMWIGFFIFRSVLLGCASNVVELNWVAGNKDAVLEQCDTLLDRDGKLSVQLQENQFPENESSDLLLRFQPVKSKNFIFGSGKYVLVQDTAKRNVVNKKLGSASSEFMGMQRIVLKAGASSMLNSSKSPGSFFIGFWMFPFSIEQESTVMEYFVPDVVSDSSGKGDKMLKVEVTSKGLRWTFFRIFQHPKYGDVKQDVILDSKESLSFGKWSHHAVSFNHLTGRLVYFLNGRIQHFTNLRSSYENDFETVFLPYFGAGIRGFSSVLTIGEGFQGLLDEVHFDSSEKKPAYGRNRYKFATNKFYLDKYHVRRCSIKSRVYDLGTKINEGLLDIFVDAEGKKNIQVDYRTSEHLPSNNNVPWKAYQKNVDVALRRYFQWKLTLLAKDEVKCIPVVRSVGVKINVLKLRRLSIPQNFHVMSNAQRVILKWSSPHPLDEVQYYLVHYGFEPGQYFPNKAIKIPLMSESPSGFLMFELDWLPMGKHIYFAMQAVSRRGERSPLSKERMLYLSMRDSM